jgi:hypothetical protein
MKKNNTDPLLDALTFMDNAAPIGMSKDAVIAFVSELSDVKVQFAPVIPVVEYPGEFALVVFNDDGLTISEDFINTSPTLRIQATLLHEVGHTKHLKELSWSDGEYEAQIWALIKSRKMGADLHRMVRSVLISWQLHEHNEYRFANRKAKENGFI